MIILDRIFGFAKQPSISTAQPTTSQRITKNQKPMNQTTTTPRTTTRTTTTPRTTTKVTTRRPTQPPTSSSGSNPTNLFNRQCLDTHNFFR